MSSPTLWSVAAGIAYSVSRVTTYWAVRGSNPGGGEFFRAVPELPRGPPSLRYSECCVSLPRVKQTVCGVDQAPLSSAEVVNELSYTSTSRICLHGLYWLTLCYDQNAPLWIHTSATKIYSSMNLHFAISFCKLHAQTWKPMKTYTNIFEIHSTLQCWWKFGSGNGYFTWRHTCVTVRISNASGHTYWREEC